MSRIIRCYQKTVDLVTLYTTIFNFFLCKDHLTKNYNYNCLQTNLCRQQRCCNISELWVEVDRGGGALQRNTLLFTFVRAPLGSAQISYILNYKIMIEKNVLISRTYFIFMSYRRLKSVNL